MLPKSATILIVDDHQAMRRTVADIMRMLGYFNLHYAEDGLMALDKLKENAATELVLLDWNMSRMSGLEFLREIRSIPKYEKLPVIMVTAEAEQELVVEAVSAGVTNYIVKPFTPITLEKKLREVFSS
ncbi:response regulator [Desulfovibrio sp. JC010]|uniref:response regulator n=1 Tax=Desulfovibrio sp. JC010 TaxID=2593641 RepID=UPI0013D8821A|nr:response regulator [Desulfovibrio sp. JC010]NDV26785.1 response regulator [Desulfovibrio sp. JC010]